MNTIKLIIIGLLLPLGISAQTAVEIIDRVDKNMSAENCFYVLKFIQSLWLPSFNPFYGPDYWPEYHSVGSTDDDVAEQAMLILDNYHPRFIWVYLADVDSYGHSGNWDAYPTALLFTIGN